MRNVCENVCAKKKMNNVYIYIYHCKIDNILFNKLSNKGSKSTQNVKW